MFKRALCFILALVLLSALSSCKKDGEDQSAVERPQPEQKEEVPVLTNSQAVEKLGLGWFFVPKDSTDIVKEEANVKKLEIRFKGCGYNEINKYATDMENAISNCGYNMYSAILEGNSVVGITEYASSTEIIENEDFAGTAYSFIYKTDKDVFVTVAIMYYGSAGGKYGNGLCKVIMQDSTELYLQHYEEAKNA